MFIAEREVTLLRFASLRFSIWLHAGEWRPSRTAAEWDALSDAALRQPLEPARPVILPADLRAATCGPTRPAPPKPPHKGFS
jgi:hypothetical protein